MCAEPLEMINLGDSYDRASLATRGVSAHQTGPVQPSPERTDIMTRATLDPRLTRRGFLGAAGAGLTAALGCSSNTPGGNGSGDFKGQTLRVFIYTGPDEKIYREVFAPRLEAQTGATVFFDPGWWDSIPKLKASPPGQPAFDLVLTDATQGFPAIKEGVFQKIDLSRMPNVAKLSPSVLDTWVYKDGYGVTFPDSVMTLAYN
jgi:spermidine/putrescine-binding protein